jgi:hypothetical protein
MSTGLGESATQGEDNTAPNSSQTIGTTTVTPKSEISHTGNTEDILDLINNRYIYKGTYAIDTSMKPGHIVAVWQNHPYTTNDYVAHVAKMFNAYTGSQKVRARPIATFQFGGSIRLAHIPPNFSLQQVQSLPLSVLTAYDNVDLDPKNTDWVEFTLPDQRNTMYHYMKPLADLEAADFGGYFVVYVAGSVISTATVAGQVQFLFETAGNFSFLQPAPISPQGSGGDSGPIPAEILSNLLYQPGCDSLTNSAQNNAVQVVAITRSNSLLGGFAFATSVTGGRPEDVSTRSKISWYDQLLRDNASVLPRTFAVPLNPAVYAKGTTFNADIARDLTGTKQAMCLNNAEMHFAEINVMLSTDSASPKMFPCIIAGAFEAQPNKLSFIIPEILRPQGYVWPNTLDYPNNTQPYMGLSQYRLPTSAPITTTLLGLDTNTQGDLVNEHADESIIIFSDLFTRTADLQTVAISQWLKSNPTSPLTDYLYTLRGADNGIIAYVRLQPSGMFTTTAVSGTDVLIQSPGLHMAFERNLSPVAPLPAPPTTKLQTWSKITRKAAKHGLSLGKAHVKYAGLESI